MTHSWTQKSKNKSTAVQCSIMEGTQGRHSKCLTNTSNTTIDPKVAIYTIVSRPFSRGASYRTDLNLSKANPIDIHHYYRYLSAWTMVDQNNTSTIYTVGSFQQRVSRGQTKSRTNPTKPNPTQPNPTQPNPNQPNPTQPNPTQPNSTQPNPTQPNPHTLKKAKRQVQNTPPPRNHFENSPSPVKSRSTNRSRSLPSSMPGWWSCNLASSAPRGIRCRPRRLALPAAV